MVLQENDLYSGFSQDIHLQTILNSIENEDLVGKEETDLSLDEMVDIILETWWYHFPQQNDGYFPEFEDEINNDLERFIGEDEYKSIREKLVEICR